MEEHEARRGWSYEGGDVGGRELIDAFEIPKTIISSGQSGEFNV